MIDVAPWTVSGRVVKTTIGSANPGTAKSISLRPSQSRCSASARGDQPGSSSSLFHNSSAKELMRKAHCSMLRRSIV